MALLTKIPLSGSVHGKGVKVVATAIASGTVIHTAVATTTDGEGDDVVLYGYNSHTGDAVLTLGWGGTTDPDDLIDFTLPTKSFEVLIPGFLLRNGLEIKAACDTANVVILFGHVVRSN